MEQKLNDIRATLVHIIRQGGTDAALAKVVYELTYIISEILKEE